MEQALNKHGEVVFAEDLDERAISEEFYCPDTKKPVYWVQSFTRKAHERRSRFDKNYSVIKVKQAHVRASFRRYLARY